MTVGMLVVAGELNIAQAAAVQLQKQVQMLKKSLRGLGGLGGLLGR